jgi:hypothetical protein
MFKHIWFAGESAFIVCGPGQQLGKLLTRISTGLLWNGTQLDCMTPILGCLYRSCGRKKHFMAACSHLMPEADGRALTLEQIQYVFVFQVKLRDESGIIN